MRLRDQLQRLNESLPTVAVGSIPPLGGRSVVRVARAFGTSTVTLLEPLDRGDMFEHLAAAASGSVLPGPVVPAARVAKAQICGPATARSVGARVDVGAAACTLVAGLPSVAELWFDEPVAPFRSFDVLAEAVATVRRRHPRVRIGLHTCARVEAGALLECVAAAELDVVHFDAELVADGLVAELQRRSAAPRVEWVWGLVPTRGPVDVVAAEQRARRWFDALGLDACARRRTRIAAACGLGTLPFAEATRVAAGVRSLAQRLYR